MTRTQCCPLPPGYPHEKWSTSGSLIHSRPTSSSLLPQFHVFGLMALTRSVLPIFRAQRSGVIVNLSSISADQGYPFTAVYAASKAAVAAFTEGLNVELAGLGVSAKAIFPGQHSTRIFTKIDSAADVPPDYLPSMKAFFLANAAGSAPSVTADVIYEAVTDGKNNKARYYSGPDATVIPRLKQLLGQQYWEEFRAANSGSPSELWTSFIPRGGDPVDMNA